MGTLYYGDNLDILRRYLKDETVDLVYLDPPFKSDQNYNVLFQEKNGSAAASQIQAFEDTWHWNMDSERAYAELITQPGKVSEVMQAFRTFLGQNDMMAYLAMMAPRLVELRRVLKSTGSLYLHCDPTASHYLKLLLDAVFGATNFKNEISWPRTNAHNIASKHFSRIHDTVFFYAKTEDCVWNYQFGEFSPQQLDRYFRDPETGRMVTGQDLTMTGNPDRNFEWRGTRPPPNRGWGLPLEQLEELWAKGLILKKKDGTPRLDGRKVFLDEKKGKPVSDVWVDIGRIGNTAKERLGYPTQKPVALLERIIQASSDPGDVVLDPFCGCGTTIDAAQKLGRDWIGIDITQLAITLIKKRLQDTYGSRIQFVSGVESQKEKRSARVSRAVSGVAPDTSDARMTSEPKEIPRPHDVIGGTPMTATGTVALPDLKESAHPEHISLVHVIGEPTTPADAAKLADEDKFQFQWWALHLVGARPEEPKKGADRGIDGKVLFRDDPKAAKPEQIIIQVKGGKTGVKDVRDLRGVLDREKAAIGILISLQPPTGPMETEAASAGFYEHKTNKQKYPRIQLRTVRELMDGKGIERPSSVAAFDDTFKKAPVSKKKHGRQPELGV